ncbi:beta-phosphoglucomutase [Algibacter amylolyticus]|uniref:Beta-phosphoglucomutase n=1 Tax=Algibacter amylolyticus TaxID=1608400 RepID=A0A5M7BMW5_9FLAO|nr:beta-phosphoglucomutase [Algibacter amylolyticus]KAA5828015.1 beta-phosphoglucomutase [Algibacter amylolyticus]MBB5267258.1 beta-phosphoglucomutase [Algibacter amylolyticus]TSJ82260.1 beta-phosphoglucomutase [Algibacter amylolyticus]
MNKIGVIFDLDGVIVDTAKYHFLAWKELANHLGFEFTEAHNELLKGVSRVRSLEILLGIGKVELSDEKKQEFLVSKNEHYLQYIHKMGPEEILPGASNLLDTLDDLGIQYVLGSASKNAPLILKQVNLFDRFVGIVDGNSVSKAKPDPEVFLIGAEKLKLKPEQCVVFEDAIAGIDAANAAHMISIGVGDKETLSKADFNVEDLTEITSGFIKSLITKIETVK